MHRRPWLGDWILAGYCLSVAGLCVIRSSAVPGWWAYALAHIAVSGIALTLARFDRPGIVGFLRRWDVLLYLPVLFLMAMQLVHRIHPVDYDGTLMKIDSAIGGIALLRSMVNVETAALTDLCKLLWMSYYPVPLLVGIPVYFLRHADFPRVKVAFVTGWLGSYACYFALPAVGPGYHEATLRIPQPRWEETALSAQAKSIIQALDAPDPRHTFPSGHVCIAALVIFYLMRHRLWKWAIVGVPIAAGIIFSTLYLRYHYVVDVIAGLALAAACVGIGRLQSRDAPPTIGAR